MYKIIPTILFKDTISLLETYHTKEQVLDILCVSRQWLYDNTNAVTDTVKIKRDKWQAIKSLAQDTAVKQSQLLNQLKDY